tara:strand:- start:313 stop:1071 length:759 start_codon:yes stop_codon:yes gene_type:complete
MKKYILYLLTVLVVLTSCEKEDDLLAPIPPNTNITNTTNNNDTTTNNNGNGTDLQAFEDYVVATNNGGVTVLPSSQTCPLGVTTAMGEGYNVIRAEYKIVCSETTNSPLDTSYSYVSTNYISPNSSWQQFGNGFVCLYASNESPVINGQGVKGRFNTTVYPRNANTTPPHAFNFNEEMMIPWITDWSYTPGMLTMDLLTYDCNGQQVAWTVQMVVTEYSDGTITLSIDQGTYTSLEGYTWNTHLKVVLQKNF